MSETSAVPTNRPAEFWLRALAKFADLLVLTLLSGFLLFFSALLHAKGTSASAAFWFWVGATLAAPLLYFAFFTSGPRQSFGSRLAGIRAETIAGSGVGFGRALGRSFLAVLFLFVPYLFWIDYLPFLSKQKRALHDMATRTQVIKIARPRLPALLLCTALLFVNYYPFMLGLQQISARSYFIPSGAMEKTLQVGDQLLVNTLIYRISEPQFGDIVVFKAPPASGSNGQDFIKRCIGVPGDVIEIKKNKLYRNGKLVREPYAYWHVPTSSDLAISLVTPKTSHLVIFGYDMKIVDGQIYYSEQWNPALDGGIWIPSTQRKFAPNQKRIANAKPEAVPPGQYLMLGDNRNNSNDSHMWGFVPRENLVGKAMFRFWPLERMGGF